MLYWLYVLFSKYKDSNAEEDIALVLAGFHYSSPLPIKMESILPFLLRFTVSPSTEYISAIDDKNRNRLKLDVIRFIFSQNEYNTNLLIDHNIVAVGLPLLEYQAFEYAWCVMVVCQTKSIEHKNKIINTPGFLPEVVSILTRYLKMTPKEREYKDHVGVLMRSVAYCCGSVLSGCDVGDDDVVMNMNDYAQQLCVSHHIPTLVLDIFKKVFSPPYSRWSHNIINIDVLGIAVESLSYLYSPGTFKPDAPTQAMIVDTVDALLHHHAGTQIADVICRLVRLCGDFLMCRLIRTENFKKLLWMLEDWLRINLYMIYSKYFYALVCVLKTLCVSDSAHGIDTDTDTGAGGKNPLLGAFKLLLQVERGAQKCLSAARGEEAEEDLYRVRRIRDKACLCLCLLMKGYV
jgi:hypothetical protein